MIPNLAKPNLQWNLHERLYIDKIGLDVGLCNDLIESGEGNVNPGVNKYPTKFQVSFRSCLLPLGHDIHTALQPVWDRVLEHFKFNIDFIEPYELKMYTESDYFGKHVDNYYSITGNIDRKITMSIQLNDPVHYTDGKLIVIDTPIPVRQGTIVAFPSYFPHEVSPVQTGERWSLIGWAWGPYWR